MSAYDLESTVRRIAENYGSDAILFTDPNHHFPSRETIIDMVKDIRRVMFPRYFGDETPTGTDPEYFIGETLIKLKVQMERQLREALLFRNEKNGVEEDVTKQVAGISDRFFTRLPDVQRMLLKDVQAFFDGDPAAQSKEEIIFCYPGFLAIFIYRVAHELYMEDVPLIPRIMTEYAHSLTGVDINAGATIDEYFFIDHATGVVIGETTVIGKHVKIYQGVTLGATSTRGGQRLAGVRRHPTIEDNVTIYSNASILGGDTVIGEGSIIGGSAFITESVPPNSRVSGITQKIAAGERGGSWADEYVDGAGI